MTTPEELVAARYGKKSGLGKPMIIGIVSVIALVFFSFAIYASFFGKPLASVSLLSYQKVDSTHISGKYQALTGTAAASCVFKAYSTDGYLVGYSEVAVPAGTSDRDTFEVVVKTVVPAAILKADDCSVK